MSESNKQSENERNARNTTHLVSINEEDVTPEGADDNSMGEQSYGEDFLGKSHKERSKDK